MNQALLGFSPLLQREICSKLYVLQISLNTGIDVAWIRSKIHLILYELLHTWWWLLRRCKRILIISITYMLLRWVLYWRILRIDLLASSFSFRMPFLLASFYCAFTKWMPLTSPALAIKMHWTLEYTVAKRVLWLHFDRWSFWTIFWS